MNSFIIDIAEFSFNLSGFIVGLSTFISIWLGHHSCIWCEYYFTKRFWIVFLIGGLLLIVGAFFCENIILGAILSILGFTYLWGIGEIIEQEKRVEKGWFPKRKK